MGCQPRRNLHLSRIRFISELNCMAAQLRIIYFLYILCVSLHIVQNCLPQGAFRLRFFFCHDSIIKNNSINHFTFSFVKPCITVVSVCLMPKPLISAFITVMMKMMTKVMLLIMSASLLCSSSLMSRLPSIKKRIPTMTCKTKLEITRTIIGVQNSWASPTYENHLI